MNEKAEALDIADQKDFEDLDDYDNMVLSHIHEDYIKLKREYTRLYNLLAKIEELDQEYRKVGHYGDLIHVMARKRGQLLEGDA